MSLPRLVISGLGNSDSRDALYSVNCLACMVWETPARHSVGHYLALLNLQTRLRASGKLEQATNVVKGEALRHRDVSASEIQSVEDGGLAVKGTSNVSAAR